MNADAHGTEALRCRVTGRVQGVFFRASTQRRAVELGLVGYARNRSDGSVEVLAVGAPAAVAQLRTWLAEGPPAARVSAVDCEPVPVPEPPPRDFGVR
ncbi:acylphosphatase [Thioalkalivibrio paradoxus]|uniref:Acylphosphatase n=1 Tax=Thioalkalivibrio paradoxus ARh 1 TaxID=713585 RepID=W0DKH0_9GAMM|nr:acylphosphatase [Thioalkalivibrio paradoxus]AHE97385.1 acylphosphatase [Thioalkalivibrio paradoxus ARh 1]